MDKTILFYVFSVIMVFAALRVITDRNPVHAALYLVLTFFTGLSMEHHVKQSRSSVVKKIDRFMQAVRSL